MANDHQVRELCIQYSSNFWLTPTYFQFKLRFDLCCISISIGVPCTLLNNISLLHTNSSVPTLLQMETLYRNTKHLKRTIENPANRNVRSHSNTKWEAYGINSLSQRTKQIVTILEVLKKDSVTLWPSSWGSCPHVNVKRDIELVAGVIPYRPNLIWFQFNSYLHDLRAQWHLARLSVSRILLPRSNIFTLFQSKISCADSKFLWGKEMQLSPIKGPEWDNAKHLAANGTFEYLVVNIAFQSWAV